MSYACLFHIPSSSHAIIRPPRLEGQELIRQLRRPGDLRGAGQAEHQQIQHLTVTAETGPKTERPGGHGGRDDMKWIKQAGLGRMAKLVRAQIRGY